MYTTDSRFSERNERDSRLFVLLIQASRTSQHVYGIYIYINLSWLQDSLLDLHFAYPYTKMTLRLCFTSLSEGIASETNNKRIVRRYTWLTLLQISQIEFAELKEAADDRANIGGTIIGAPIVGQQLAQYMYINRSSECWLYADDQAYIVAPIVGLLTSGRCSG